jgi:hypothetical protein
MFTWRYRHAKCDDAPEMDLLVRDMLDLESSDLRCGTGSVVTYDGVIFKCQLKNKMSARLNIVNI